MYIGNIYIIIVDLITHFYIFITISSQYTELQVGGDSCDSQFLSGVTAYYSACTSMSKYVSLKVAISSSKT